MQTKVTRGEAKFAFGFVTVVMLFCGYHLWHSDSWPARIGGTIGIVLGLLYAAAKLFGGHPTRR